MSITSRSRDVPGRRRPTRLVVAAVATLALTVGGIGVGATHAAPPTDDPATAAEYGARWVATQVTADGYIASAGTTPNVGSTLQGAVALAIAEVEEPTFDRMIDWLSTNVELVIDVGGDDDPGRIGLLLMLAEASGTDPADFGGVDLPARLQATLGTYEISPGVFVDGLYGAADPTYDGVFRQSLAILGLSRIGTVPAAATTWLLDQQCDGATPEAAGGWEAFRADTSVPCSVPNPGFFSGADTNSTAMALEALAGLGPFAGDEAALDFLADAMNADGGFGYITGGDSDVNSTALVTQAIRAGGDDPTTGRWAQGPVTPVTYLLSWQLGCDAPVADQGAFSSPFVATPGTDPDVLATIQAVWGVSGEVFPLVGPTVFHAAAVPCVAPTTSTTTTTAPTTPTTTTPPSPAARPVVTQPNLAG